VLGPSVSAPPPPELTVPEFAKLLAPLLSEVFESWVTEFDEFTMCDDEVVLEALAVLPPPPLVDWATAPPAPSVSMTHPNTASTPTVRTPYERKYFANCIELSTFCRWK